MQEIEIAKRQGTVQGACVSVPPSKSLSNRALLLASLSTGTCTLKNVLVSDDTKRMLEALKALGVKLEEVRLGEVKIEGLGGLFKAPKPLTLDLGNAGTAMRPLCAALAVSEGEFTLTGIERMMQRPIGPLTEALKEAGARIEYLNNSGFPPLKIKGSKLHTHALHISGQTSSQFISALLMIGPLLAEGLELKVDGDLISKLYVDLTLSLMQSFGAKVTREGYSRFKVEPTGYQSPASLTVEGDASSASYFMAAGGIAGELKILGLGKDSVQGDLKFAQVLEKMGAKIEIFDDCIEVQKSDLQGISIDMNDMPDAAMTLVPLALYTKGPVTITNIASWRVKETDRIAAFVNEMQKLGVKVESGADFISVDASFRNQDKPYFDTYDDHRMAMCLSLVAFDRDIVIKDPDCTRKTFPGYFEIFNKVTF